MKRDPQFVALAALMMGIGYPMFCAGLKKHALELKPRPRICPSCGRHISGNVCREH